MGPIDYSTNYPLGLLIDGFDTPPRVMMNHNPPYYAGLLESWGLAKTKDLYCWWFVDPKDMVAKWHDRAERIARRSGVAVRSFRVDDFDADVQRCRDVYNAARTKNWGFVQADGRRVPLLRQADDPAGGPRTDPAGRGGRQAGRLLDHAARRERGHRAA